MKKLSKVLKGGVLAAFATLVFAGSTFALNLDGCFDDGGATGTSTAKYSTIHEGSGNVYCTTYTKDPSSANATGETVKVYGDTSADCQLAATIIANPDKCKSDDLNSIIGVIINTIIFVIGMVAVVMIIIGGISYATSQGDPSKVKKGKDTILYGIIGLVVALLAFAIVQFVLNALNS